MLQEITSRKKDTVAVLRSPVGVKLIQPLPRENYGICRRRWTGQKRIKGLDEKLRDSDTSTNGEVIADASAKDFVQAMESK